MSSPLSGYGIAVSRRLVVKSYGFNKIRIELDTRHHLRLDSSSSRPTIHRHHRRRQSSQNSSDRRHHLGDLRRKVYVVLAQDASSKCLRQAEALNPVLKPFENLNSLITFNYAFDYFSLMHRFGSGNFVSEITFKEQGGRVKVVCNTCPKLAQHKLPSQNKLDAVLNCWQFGAF